MKRRAAVPAEAATRPSWLMLGAFVAMAVVAYWPALHGGILWDDIGHLTRPDLQSLAGLRRMWFDLGATQQYYPVVHSAFWLFHRMWGEATLGYHLANVALHATSAFLLVLLLRRLAVPGALLLGALFLLHPVHAESVAWMTELKNTLSGTLYLFAAYTYLRFDERRTRRAYVVTLVVFFLAVFTKTVTATLPAALLVVFWWQRGKLRWTDDVKPLLPLFAIGVTGGLITIWVERTFIGATGSDYTLGLFERGLLAGRVIVFYLTKLVWPVPLMFMYPRWHVSAAVWWQYLFPILVIGALALCVLLRARTRAPLAVLLLFIGTLGPALGFIDVYPFRYSFVADHFQYLASIPILAAVAAASSNLADRYWKRRAELVLVAVFGVPLAILTWRESHNYVEIEQLFRVALERNPSCWMCHDNLAVARTAAGDFQGAMAHVSASVALEPRNATARYNRGSLYEREGRVDDAAREYREAIRLRPGLVAAHQRLGMVLRDQNRLAEALEELRLTVRLAPTSPAARLELGVGLIRAGRFVEATAELSESLRLKPAVAQTHDALGSALRQQGRLEESVTHYREAARLEPLSPEYLNNLGRSLTDLGRPGEAVGVLQEAVRLGPGEALVHFNLGLAFAEAGRMPEAAAAFQAAARIEPDNADVQAALRSLPPSARAR